MPNDEYLKWLSYFKYKKPNIQEQQMAVLSTIVVNGIGGKARVTDFLLSGGAKPEPKKLDANALRGIFGITPSTEN